MTACGKMVFLGRAHAKAYARDRRKQNNGMKDTQPYRCRLCGGWHLTSLSKPEQRRRRRTFWT